MAKSFDDLLGSNIIKKAPKKATKKSAAILIVPENVQVEIDSLIKAKKAKKVAESDIKKAEPSILEFGNNLKDEKALAGKFQKSFKIGTDESNVNFVTANKWSFKEEDVDEIKELIDLAEGNADEMMIEERGVKLKKEVFSDPELQKKFIKMVGKKFPEYFETVISYHVSTDFDEKIYDLGEGAIEDLKLLMKQSKPSLR